jgi:septum formation protein
VLASGSPRRALLLSTAGYEFRVEAPDVDETQIPGEDAAEMVLRLSADKAAAVASAHDEAVLAADTVVVLDGDVMGKPTDEDDAIRMLTSLAGRSHTVLTGWNLRTAEGERFGVSESSVRFRPLTTDQILEYLRDVQPMDKAGAYAIQADGGRIIESVTGSRANVMGLPIGEIAVQLQEIGIMRTASTGG